MRLDLLSIPQFSWAWKQKVETFQILDSIQFVPEIRVSENKHDKGEKAELG